MSPSSTASPQHSYAELVQTLRALGAALRPAVAAQHEAPPQGAARGGGLVPNPTLDIVLDPRRLALSEAVSDTVTDIRRASALLGPHITNLQTAVLRWEGGEAEGAPAS